MIPLTQRAKLASQQQTIRPQLILSIDGLTKVFGLSTIYEAIRIGDTDLYIDNYAGDPWYIGDLRPVSDQGSWISFAGGMGTTARYAVQLQPDKGLSSSVGTFSVGMIDKDEGLSEIISPGFVIDDLLYKECKVQLGFDQTEYPKDFITIFRGVVESIDSGAGNVTLVLSSADQKARQMIYTGFSTEIDPVSGFLNTSGTENCAMLATLDLPPITGPSGGIDTAYSRYIKVEDEVLLINSVSGLAINATHAQLGTVGSTHAGGATVAYLYRLQGNGLDLARKIMLSGWGGYWKTGVTLTHFNRIPPTTTVANTIYFDKIDVQEEYGLYPGEYITTTGAANGANNVTLKAITDITVTEDGSYITVAGVTFVEELNSAATISFRSKWDTLPIGLKMTPKDVDLAEFDFLYTTFLSSFDFDFRITEGFNGKDFIDTEIMRPMSCYTIPRKGRVSVGYHIGPLPEADILTLSADNVENASALKLKRSVSKNCVNQVEYLYELDPLTDKLTKSKTASDSASITKFQVKGQTIKSRGMRTSTAAETKINSASTRILNRYSDGAEWIDSIDVRFGDAFNREIGDIVAIDFDSLNITDTKTGTRDGTTRLFQIQNKAIDIPRGKITINVVDTKFDGSARYGLISPASLVQNGVSQTVFNIKPSFSMAEGANEYLKWTRFLPCSLRVRSPDGVTRNAVREVLQISGNTITMATALGFTPQADDILEFPHYNEATGTMKAQYVFMRDTAPFDDGEDLFQML